jgi:hypothetical protein
MIKSLRKRHLQIWLMLTFLLPFGIISAWLVVPKPPTDHLLQPPLSASLPVILKTIETNNYKASLRCNTDTSDLQLEWINKSALTTPSAIIYKTESKESKPVGSAIIGRIGERGIYHFALKKDKADQRFHFLLYDIIHHQVIDRINF